MGALLGSQCLNFIVVAFIRWYRLFQIPLVAAFIFCIIWMETQVQTGNITLMCILAFCLGLFLMMLLSQEIYQFEKYTDYGNVPLLVTFIGVYGCLFTALGDKTHYMNRDDPTWSYVNLTFTIVTVLWAFWNTWSWPQNGCRCCGSCQRCCTCCIDCCGRHDEDDMLEEDP